VARQLKEAEGLRVILLGGTYQKESESMVGPMSRDPGRGEVMSEFVKQADKVYFLSDLSKLGKKAIKTICRPSDADFIVSDKGVSNEYKTYFKECGIGLIT